MKGKGPDSDTYLSQRYSELRDITPASSRGSLTAAGRGKGANATQGYFHDHSEVFLSQNAQHS